jgi:hypothetical protein
MKKEIKIKNCHTLQCGDNCECPAIVTMSIDIQQDWISIFNGEKGLSAVKMIKKRMEIIEDSYSTCKHLLKIAESYPHCRWCVDDLTKKILNTSGYSKIYNKSVHIMVPILEDS